MVIKVERTVELELRECPNCGSFVALTKEQWRRRREGRENGYWCPNGHKYGWWETEEDRQRKRAEVAESKVAALNNHNDNLLTELGRKTKEIKNIHKRTKAGVCTFCHRTFQNVARHMTSKHSEN